MSREVPHPEVQLKPQEIEPFYMLARELLTVLAKAENLELQDPERQHLADTADFWIFHYYMHGAAQLMEQSDTSSDQLPVWEPLREKKGLQEGGLTAFAHMQKQLSAMIRLATNPREYFTQEQLEIPEKLLAELEVFLSQNRDAVQTLALMSVWHDVGKVEGITDPKHPDKSAAHFYQFWKLFEADEQLFDEVRELGRDIQMLIKHHHLSQNMKRFVKPEIREKLAAAAKDGPKDNKSRKEWLEIAAQKRQIIEAAQAEDENWFDAAAFLAYRDPADETSEGPTEYGDFARRDMVLLALAFTLTDIYGLDHYMHNYGPEMIAMSEALLEHLAKTRQKERLVPTFQTQVTFMPPRTNPVQDIAAS